MGEVLETTMDTFCPQQFQTTTNMKLSQSLHEQYRQLSSGDRRRGNLLCAQKPHYLFLWGIKSQPTMKVCARRQMTKRVRLEEWSQNHQLSLLSLKSNPSSGPGQRAQWLRAFTTQAPPKSSSQNPSKSGENYLQSCPLAGIPMPCHNVHIHGIHTIINFLKSYSRRCSDLSPLNQSLQDTSSKFLPEDKEDFLHHLIRLVLSFT